MLTSTNMPKSGLRGLSLPSFLYKMAVNKGVKTTIKGK